MFSKSLTYLLAMASLTYAMPTPELEQRAVQYKLYTGDGTNWPAQTAWASFDTMWANNQAILSSSCAQFGQANNSPTEIAEILSAIKSVSSSTGVDNRFILAITMQESGGCVRAPTSNGGVSNPGLMQDHNGIHSCNSGTAQNPCPAAQITGMITDGTAGTASGDGLKQCLAQSGVTGARASYIAARIYNTGSYAAGADLGKPKYGTSCYASDIANRLLGWAGAATPCNLPNPS
ncbi:glycoside hydrolase protein [Rutstroemia sp. NJR-2017a WRK4]|nr:glycoside hydrolase protein [Rutstroemia sp. NJR-2017a WRK4]